MQQTCINKSSCVAIAQAIIPVPRLGAFLGLLAAGWLTSGAEAIYEKNRQQKFLISILEPTFKMLSDVNKIIFMFSLFARFIKINIAEQTSISMFTHKDSLI